MSEILLDQLEGAKRTPAPDYVQRAHELDAAINSYKNGEEADLHNAGIQVCCLNREVTWEYSRRWTHEVYRNDAAILCQLLKVALQTLRDINDEVVESGSKIDHFDDMILNTSRRVTLFEMMAASDHSWTSRKAIADFAKTIRSKQAEPALA